MVIEQWGHTLVCHMQVTCTIAVQMFISDSPLFVYEFALFEV